MAFKFPTITEGVTKATKKFFEEVFSGTEEGVAGTYAPLASPSLTGTPKAPSAGMGTRTTQVATTAFVGESLSLVEVNTQVAAYTLVLTDAGKCVEYNSASAGAITVPPHSSVAYPVGTIIGFAQIGAGQLEIKAGVGVTIRTSSSLKTRKQYSEGGLRQRAENEWVVAGDLE